MQKGLRKNLFSVTVNEQFNLWMQSTNWKTKFVDQQLIVAGETSRLTCPMTLILHCKLCCDMYLLQKKVKISSKISQKAQRQYSSLLFFYPEFALRFLGNVSHVDFFKLLRQDGNSLLIGARNVVYNISIHTLVENEEQVRCNRVLMQYYHTFLILTKMGLLFHVGWIPPRHTRSHNPWFSMMLMDSLIVSENVALLIAQR